jgi:hypothetical protein
MDIRLLRRPLPHSAVRASGIAPTDRYLEWCWGPVVGPSTTALVRRAAELTADSGEARLPLSDLSRLLGLGSAEAPTRNNRLVHTLDRVERYGLAFTSVGIPGELVTFWIHDQITVVPRRLLDRLPEVAQQVHAVTVARVNQTLRAQGFPALRDQLPDVRQAPVGLRAAHDGRPAAPRP